MVVGTQRFGSPRKGGVWQSFCGRAFLCCKIQLCVTRKQHGLTLESLHSGFFTNQPEQPKAPVGFHFKLSKADRKPFAFD